MHTSVFLLTNCLFCDVTVRNVAKDVYEQQKQQANVKATARRQITIQSAANRLLSRRRAQNKKAQEMQKVQIAIKNTKNELEQMQRQNADCVYFYSSMLHEYVKMIGFSIKVKDTDKTIKHVISIKNAYKQAGVYKAYFSSAYHKFVAETQLCDDQRFGLMFYVNAFADSAEYVAETMRQMTECNSKSKKGALQEMRTKNYTLMERVVLSLNWLKSLTNKNYKYCYLYNMQKISIRKGLVKSKHAIQITYKQQKEIQVDCKSKILMYMIHYIIRHRFDTIQDMIENDNAAKIREWIQKNCNENFDMQDLESALQTILLQKSLTTKIDYLVKREYFGITNEIISEYELSRNQQTFIDNFYIQHMHPDFYNIAFDTKAMITTDTLKHAQNLLTQTDCQIAYIDTCKDQLDVYLQLYYKHSKTNNFCSNLLLFLRQIDNYTNEYKKIRYEISAKIMTAVAETSNLVSVNTNLQLQHNNDMYEAAVACLRYRNKNLLYFAKLCEIYNYIVQHMLCV